MSARTLAVISTHFFLSCLACEDPGVDRSSLPRPLYAWSHGMGLCGHTRLMDGAQSLWAEGGCENGAERFYLVKRLGAEETDRVVSSFSAIRTQLPDGTVAGDCGNMTAHYFSIDEVEVDAYLVQICGLADPEALGEPFASAAASLSGN